MTSWIIWDSDEDDDFIEYCAHCGQGFDESELRDIGITETVKVCRDCQKAFYTQFGDDEQVEA